MCSSHFIKHCAYALTHLYMRLSNFYGHYLLSEGGGGLAPPDLKLGGLSPLPPFLPLWQKLSRIYRRNNSSKMSRRALELCRYLTALRKKQATKRPTKQNCRSFFTNKILRTKAVENQDDVMVQQNDATLPLYSDKSFEELRL